MSTPARDVYVATLEPRPGGRVLRGARFAGAFVAELAWQLLPSPSTHDVVVTRRADGRELLRQPAGPPMTMGTDLAQVQEHLDTLDADAFRERWASPTGRDTRLLRDGRAAGPQPAGQQDEQRGRHGRAGADHRAHHPPRTSVVWETAELHEVAPADLPRACCRPSLPVPETRTASEGVSSPARNTGQG